MRVDIRRLLATHDAAALSAVADGLIAAGKGLRIDASRALERSAVLYECAGLLDGAGPISASLAGCPICDAVPDALDEITETEA